MAVRRTTAVSRGSAFRTSRFFAQRRRTGYAFITPAILVLAAITLYPLIYNIWLSLQHRVLTEPFENHAVGLANYRYLFSNGEFWHDLLRTLMFTGIAVCLELVLGMILALVASKPFRARALLRVSILIPWAIPTAVAAMLWSMFFDSRTGFVDFFLGRLGLPGSHLVWFNSHVFAWFPIILSDMWKNTPFMALLLMAGLQAVPKELYESARMDGAGNWQGFWRITVPLMRPVILVALIFRTLSALLIFSTVFVMTGGGPGTSTEVIAYYNWYQFFTSLNYGYGAAISVVITIIAMALAFSYIQALARQGGLTQ